jgi:hypothetical protein
MLIFNMGDGRGILWRNGLAVEGRFAFALKNRIDKAYGKYRFPENSGRG